MQIDENFLLGKLFTNSKLYSAYMEYVRNEQKYHYTKISNMKAN